jgi:glycosyltransferase involved in cell wall biosynthesis
MTRILYFSLDYSPHDHRFLSALSETEHEVFYARLQRGPCQTEDRPVPEKIQQILWSGGQKEFEWRDLPRLTLDLRRVIKAIKPDLIHAGPIQTCAFIAVLSGFRPILTMSWGFDLMEDVRRNRRMEWITRYTLTRSAFFTSDAEVTRAKAIQYGMNPDRTVVFPWGVDLDTFNVPARQRVDAPTFTVFCNRSWEPRYGVDVLARAFVKAAQQRENVDLLLLSGGSQANLLKRIFINGGVTLAPGAHLHRAQVPVSAGVDRVTFAGQIAHKDLPRYYHMADLYVSPSHVDGSSVSLMEALACGLPCLVSDIPANREWISDGENGWLFSDGNADLLAAKILEAMDQRPALEKISKAARATAEAKANWKNNFSKLLNAYETIAKRKQ